MGNDLSMYGPDDSTAFSVDHKAASPSNQQCLGVHNQGVLSYGQYCCVGSHGGVGLKFLCMGVPRGCTCTQECLDAAADCVSAALDSLREDGSFIDHFESHSHSKIPCPKMARPSS